MADRKTVTRGNQIKDRTVTTDELDASNINAGYTYVVQNDGTVAFTDAIIKNSDNIVLNAFRIAINGSLTQFNMIDGIVDEYEDESGIDTASSTNEAYNATDDLYRPAGAGGDTDIKLLLHLNGTDGATSTTDSSPSAHIFTFVGDAQLDTADKKFGTASLLVDGTDDRITAPDSADWDIGASNSDDWTIDLWVKHVDHAGLEHYIGQHKTGSTDYWLLFHRDGASFGLTFEYNKPGFPSFLKLDGGEITDTDWHHIALCKVGNDYGIYKDGTQVAYDTTDTLITLSELLYIGGHQEGNRMNGWLDEIRIIKSNDFSAAPVVGLTDTITVPTSEHTSTGTPTNMTLISESFTAEAEPDSARIVLLQEDVDSITLNTDLTASVSKDGGSTYALASLVDEGDFDSTRRILTATVDLTASGIGSGTSMIYKIETLNTKDLKIHGTGLSWD